jgi:hypothetical protein
VDRIRLLTNQLFLTLGFERLQDNTANLKTATTAFTNFNIAASYFPRPDVPSFTVGFSRYTTDNGLSPRGVDSLSAIDDATNRYYAQSSYSFLLGARHTATAGISVSERSDATIRRNDVTNVSIDMGLNTDYAIPLRTMLAIGLHRNALPTLTSTAGQQDYNYTMLSLHARYTFIPAILTGMMTIAPTLGDYERTAYEVGGEWFPYPDLSVLLQLSYFAYKALPRESIISLRCRYAL